MSVREAPVSLVGTALHRSEQGHPPRLHLGSWRPYIGIVGVLFGAVMATLGSRTTSFGLADLRGGLHVGFDEGAWITTCFGVGQMLVGLASPYLGAVFGARRVLLAGIVVFFASSLLAPLTDDFVPFLLLMGLGGMGSGTFIPLTISFVLRSLPARLVIFGLAAYAMNSELSQNVAASLEGWYAEHLSWHWIYWQYCAALPIMFAAIWFGVPREKVKSDLLASLDWTGLLYASIGFGLLFAGLDQGNRLDWIGNGLVVGLLAGGALLTTVFVIRELTTANPFLNLRLLLHGNLALMLVALGGLRFIILSTAYIIPSYLQTVQNFRELQVGEVLLWIALPQLLIVVPLAMTLRRIDGRWMLALGVVLIGAACLMTSRLTSVWTTGDFLPSQVLQAIGQSLALTSLTVLLVRSIVPVEALTIGCLLQTSRLFGGEIGTASMQTYVRLREQVHSQIIGLHVAEGKAATLDRLAAYFAHLHARVVDVNGANLAAHRLLASAVAAQSQVMAYGDGFVLAAIGALACLVLTALMRAENPATIDG